jgi:hypothetical protein
VLIFGGDNMTVVGLSIGKLHALQNHLSKLKDSIDVLITEEEKSDSYNYNRHKKYRELVEIWNRCNLLANKNTLKKRVWKKVDK